MSYLFYFENMLFVFFHLQQWTLVLISENSRTQY